MFAPLKGKYSGSFTHNGKHHGPKAQALEKAGDKVNKSSARVNEKAAKKVRSTISSKDWSEKHMNDNWRGH